MRNHYKLKLAGAGMAVLFGTLASASSEGNQTVIYPVKPVRMIVPLAPGGGSDIVGRMLAQALAEFWNQPVVVDNRPGAGSTIGTAIVARSQPDGYTMLVSSSSIAITPALYKNLSFDIKRDFSEVTLIASQPSLLAVHSSVPVKTLKEFITLAKARPGNLAFGSAGPGSATHLGTELLKFTAGIDLLHVPYKSAGQATLALLSGETQVLLTNMASLLPHIKAGKLHALGITSIKRSSLAADIPTFAESGLDKFEYATWYGMLVPADTSQTVIDRLRDDTAKVLSTPQIHQRFVGRGLEVYANTPAEFETYLNSEIARWAKVVQAAGVKLD